MLDYKLLTALAAVIEQGTFERAGQHLGLTQSAISQRVKLLESRLGCPVLKRTHPLSATEVGQRLMNHIQQVRLLEGNLIEHVPALGPIEQRLRIALNADSLATWWCPATASLATVSAGLIELVIEDQAIGLKRMQEGDVAACLCSSEMPIQGARSHFLGHMRYRALASPDYVNRYFPNGTTAEALSQAPALVFGPNDRLQHDYLASIGYHHTFPYHGCPTVEGYLRMALNGWGYGMIPEIQAPDALKEGKLVDIQPGTWLDVPLYWHHWRQSSRWIETFTQQLIKQAPQWLKP